MKITNRTNYDTSDLRRFTYRAFETLNVLPEQRERYQIEFVYYRDGSMCRALGKRGRRIDAV